MKRLILMAAILLAVLTGAAQAACFGSDAFSTCTDSSGNSYSVQRFGNTTSVQGSNPDGSSWSQNSNTMGNTTYTNGETNGQQWNMTAQHNGPFTTYSGTNAAGQPFFHSCSQYGGCN
jgi:hypothetical protein